MSKVRLRTGLKPEDKIRALSYVGSIDTMLTNGVGYNEVIKYMKDKGDFKSNTDSTVYTWLKKYWRIRKQELGIEGVKAQVSSKRIDREEQLSVYKELVILYKIQYERIKRGLEIEKGGERLDPKMYHEIKTGAALLKQITGIYKELNVLTHELIGIPLPNSLEPVPTIDIAPTSPEDQPEESQLALVPDPRSRQRLAMMLGALEQLSADQLQQIMQGDVQPEDGE